MNTPHILVCDDEEHIKELIESLNRSILVIR
jgi:hypothetical protein